ncbi:MAG: hypothetical protein HY512_03870 [Candidatus Aenigmarchaeota archaeon]|nr:hypothetical protein [Candidatus Aenigmarchaeota archaeon]
MKEVLKDLGYRERILNHLNGSDRPQDIEKIRVSTEIGNWNTCLKHCLELMINREIEGQKTSKSWVFWKKGKVSTSPK